MAKRLARYEKGHRVAIVREGTYMSIGKVVVDFYYDGYPDFEWKKAVTEQHVRYVTAQSKQDAKQDIMLITNKKPEV